MLSRCTTDASALSPLATNSELAQHPRAVPRSDDCVSLSTLNTLPLEATIHYQFHPYANQTFKVLQRSGSVSSQITLEPSPGKSFTVPLWMIDPSAKQFRLRHSVTVEIDLYFEVLALLEASCCAVETFSAVETTNGSTKPPI